MKIILIRHASRVAAPDDPHLPLSPEGEEECRELAGQLVRLHLMPSLYLTSHHKHARQTADLLRQQIGEDPSARLVEELDTLTPGQRFTLEAIINEAAQRGHDLQHIELVAFVAHHPRINQLVARMTSQKEMSTKFKGGEAICLKANTLDDFLEGKGKEFLRIVG